MARLLQKAVHAFGKSKYLITDRGGEFTAKVFRKAVSRVGAIQRFSAVRWGLAGNIVFAWILTIPAAALVAAAVYWPIQGIF